MGEFINSNSFTGFATILTGAIAWLVYYVQKTNSKVQAARLILTEIRIAEEKIKQIKEIVENENFSIDLPSVLAVNSWKKYSNIFIKDFDEDEVKILSSFYDLAESIDDFAKRKNDFFWVATEERAKVTQQKLGDIIMSTNDEQEIEERRKSLLDFFDRFAITYTPSKPFMSIKKHISNIQFITTSSCGLKLKKLAKL